MEMQHLGGRRPATGARRGEGDRGRPSCWETGIGDTTDCYGNWLVVPDEPLEYVVNHSDCDGEIAVEHLPALLARLEEILPDIVEDDFGTRRRTMTFIAGIKRAIQANEPIEFR